MAIVRRTPPPPVPVALMAKRRYGDLIVIRVPEARIKWFSSQGWLLLAKDTDHPMELPEGHMFDPCMDAAFRQSRPSPHLDDGDPA